MNDKHRPPFELLELTNYQITASPHLTTWLAEQQVSLLFTNPLGHHLFLIGLKADGCLSISSCHFDRCMGLTAVDSHTLFMVTRYQIWRLENALPPGETTEAGYDRLYLPQMAYTTGYLNIHDIGVNAAGGVVFVNTRFACLARPDEANNFSPLWKPHFIAGWDYGDPCHLNGLAMRQGQPAYVTSFSQTNQTPESWRDHRLEGGSVIAVEANQTVLTGLCMPHSPRWYHGRLWLTESGTGRLGWVDLARGRFEPITFAPGFLRGLAFHNNFAIVGSSKPRYGTMFEGMPLHLELEQRGLLPARGLFIVDLTSGEVLHWLSLDGVSGEIYDVIVLPDVRRPTALGFENDDIERIITIGPTEVL